MNRFIQIFRVKDLRFKIFVVLGLLVAFRLLAAVPVPGVDLERLREFFGSNQLFGFINLFSGGGLSNLSVAMLGVGPYITATIIMQLLTIIFPKFKQMYYEEGARGQAKFNQYSRMLTVPLAILQGYGFLNLLIAQGVIDRPDTLSLIVNDFPNIVRQAAAAYSPELLPTYAGFAIVLLALVAGVVYLNEGQRKIPITYARRVRGIKMYGGSSSYLPLKVNQAGMIPLIFAISVLIFPQFVGQIISIFSPETGVLVSDWVNRVMANQLIYGIIYFVLVFVFTYFYTAITFNPEEIAKNLQRSGGFVPGIRPGETTAAFFSTIVNKITFFGAVFLGLIAILPLIIQQLTGVAVLTVSGTALLIVVAVALETMRQIDSQLTVREYEGLE